MSDFPDAMLWTSEAVDPTSGGKATIGYTASAGVWVFLHRTTGVTGYVARTKTQLARVAAKHPWTADALCTAWDLWAYRRANFAQVGTPATYSPRHTEQTPARVYARPITETP